MTGHPELVMDLADTGYASGSEPSLSYELKVDQAFCVPLLKLGLDLLPAIIPVVIDEALDRECGALLANGRLLRTLFKPNMTQQE